MMNVSVVRMNKIHSSFIMNKIIDNLDTSSTCTHMLTYSTFYILSCVIIELCTHLYYTVVLVHTDT